MANVRSPSKRWSSHLRYIAPPSTFWRGSNGFTTPNRCRRRRHQLHEFPVRPWGHRVAGRPTRSRSPRAATGPKRRRACATTRTIGSYIRALRCTGEVTRPAGGAASSSAARPGGAITTTGVSELLKFESTTLPSDVRLRTPGRAQDPSAGTIMSPVRRCKYALTDDVDEDAMKDGTEVVH